MTGGIDISQSKFGKLTAIEPTNERQGSSIMWRCLCDCGRETLVSSTRLRAGKCGSCGCSRRTDVAGKTSGKLKAIMPTLHRRDKRIVWMCECECGGSTLATATEIINGLVKSCGCVKRGRKKAVQANYKGVRQDGSQWVAFHPVCGDLSRHPTELEAACGIRDWLIDNPVFQQAWPLRGYPHP